VSANIAFLEQLREDLLDAGWRESLPSGRRVRVGRSGRRFGGRWLVAVAAIFGLIAVTSVGLLATGRGLDRLTSFARELGGPQEAPAAMPSPVPADREENIFSGYSDEDSLEGQLSVPEGGDQTASGHAAVVGDVSVGDLALIIKTGRLAILVERDTFSTRMQDAMDVAVSNDGYVQSTTTQGDRFGSLVIRVPSDRFETTVRELKELGTKVEAQTISGDDVTAEYVDLRARLHIAKARRVVLERLMNKAVSIEQTIRVQNALDDVQLRIEQYQGSMNVLEDKVTEATIRLQIREPGVQPLERKVENPSIPGAFDRAVAGFFAVIAGAVIGLGYLIPVLVFGVALFFAIRFARRRFA
jgi:hypothetical protein